MKLKPGWQPDADLYQDLCERSRLAVYGLLRSIHSTNAQVFKGLRDGGPIVQGAIAAAIEFGLEGNLTPDELRARMIETIDNVLPQLVMARHGRGGRA